MTIKEKNIGSSFDAFLREQGLAEDFEEQAVREIAADRHSRTPEVKAPRKGG